MSFKALMALFVVTGACLIVTMQILAGTAMSHDTSDDDERTPSPTRSVIVSTRTPTATLIAIATKTPTASPTATPVLKEDEDEEEDVKTATPTPQSVLRATITRMATPTATPKAKHDETDEEVKERGDKERVATRTPASDHEGSDRMKRPEPAKHESDSEEGYDSRSDRAGSPAGRPNGGTEDRGKDRGDVPRTRPTVRATETFTATVPSGSRSDFRPPSEVIGTRHDLGSAGQPSCYQCHQTHGAKGQFLWSRPHRGDSAGGVATLCASCHDGTVAKADALAPAVSGHPVVADCAQCHDPHSQTAGFLRHATR